MRVLHVAPFFPPAPTRGGMARAAADLCAALAARGHSVTVFTPEGGGEDAPPGAFEVRRFPGPRWLADRLVPFARGLGDAIATEGRGFDVAHLHGHRSGIVGQAARALRRAGRPWVLQPHGTFPHHGQRRAAKALWDAGGGMAAVSGASALLALSDAEARDLPRPSVVIGSGVRAPGGPEAPRGRRRLVFVGSDAPQKRGLALPGLLAAIPDATLDLVGPMGGAFLRAFDAFRERVAAPGPLADEPLRAVIAGADLLVHPAAGEAFGMVPFEAALLGRPAVVAGGHGCGEWFARAGGCVVPPDDPAALAAAVRPRLDDPRQGAGECARVAAFAARELTWERVARRVEDVYLAAIAREPASRATVAG